MAPVRRWLPIAALLAILTASAQSQEPAGPAPPPELADEVAEPLPPCRIRIEAIHSSDVRIGPERLLGPDTNLHREQDLLYGFVGGQPTRIRREGTRIHGTLAGKQLMLQVEQEVIGTRIAGVAGTGRMSARLGTDHLIWNGRLGHLELLRDQGSRFDGSAHLGGAMGFAAMNTQGCDWQEIAADPLVVVALFAWWL